MTSINFKLKPNETNNKLLLNVYGYQNSIKNSELE